MNSEYTMNISLNVLNHLGINLYSNTPAVLAEVIANSWDAGATRVDIKFDNNNDSVTITDDGCGMDKEELNKQYLYIGYQRRGHQDPLKGRKPMGRKGIGKLSLFSIAKKIHVQSKKGNQENAFLMDFDKVNEAIRKDNPEESKPYHPERVDYETSLHSYDNGTTIKITNLRKRITYATEKGLRQRLARRFSIFSDDFKIFLNKREIQFSDRNYFHKARFLFQYGNTDYSSHCNNLDTDENGTKCIFQHKFRFNERGEVDNDGKYSVRGWIAIAHHSNSLDDPQSSDEDNLNNIVLVVRGKVAQEDILHQHRIGALITKFIYGEIEADFFDEDKDEDIATSSRQKIVEDSPRYQALTKFIGKELRNIRTITDGLKKKKGVEKALAFNPKIKDWYERLNPSLQKKAKVLFGKIESMVFDEKERATLYVNAIIAFEKFKMNDALDELDNIEDAGRLQSLLKIFKDIDSIEAAHYYEIVNDRLKIIQKFQKFINEDEKERVIQLYIFDHLWLLDPAWERATSESKLEEQVQKAIDIEKEKDPEEVKKGRIDIKYRKISGEHVIIELKRANRRLKKTDLESQIRGYIDAVKSNLEKTGNTNFFIESIAIVGKMPIGWDNPETKRKDIESLKTYDIRILTYDELIQNAYSAYKKFIEKSGEIGELRALIQGIRQMSEQE